MAGIVVTEVVVVVMIAVVIVVVFVFNVVVVAAAAAAAAVEQRKMERGGKTAAWGEKWGRKCTLLFWKIKSNKRVTNASFMCF